MTFQRATLVHARATRAITWASLFELAVVVAVLAATIVGLSWIGAVAAATAILAGRAAATWLIVPAGRASRHGRLPVASPLPAPEYLLRGRTAGGPHRGVSCPPPQEANRSHVAPHDRVTEGVQV